MRVPGDHTPLSRGRWITHRVLLTVMHIEVHTVHVSFQDEPAQPPWNVTWVWVTPEPPPEKGAVLHGLPSSSITSLWFIAVHFFERMDGIWLCPIAMHSVCNGDCFRKCRVSQVTMCKSQSIQAYIRSDHYTYLYHSCTSVSGHLSMWKGVARF